MTKSLLIEKVAEKIEGLTTKQTAIVIDTIFSSMKEALIKGEKIEIRGFGNFRLKNRKPMKARNPKTSEKIDIPQKRILYFRAGKALRDILNSNKR